MVLRELMPPQIHPITRSRKGDTKVRSELTSEYTKTCIATSLRESDDKAPTFLPSTFLTSDEVSTGISAAFPVSHPCGSVLMRILVSVNIPGSSEIYRL